MIQGSILFREATKNIFFSGPKKLFFLSALLVAGQLENTFFCRLPYQLQKKGYFLTKSLENKGNLIKIWFPVTKVV